MANELKIVDLKKAVSVIATDKHPFRTKGVEYTCGSIAVEKHISKGYAEYPKTTETKSTAK